MGLVGILLWSGCALRPVAPTDVGVSATEVALNEEAVTGVDDPLLQVLLHDHWEHQMQASPLWATMLGDHRFDDRVSDGSAVAVVENRMVRDGFLARAEALPDPESVSDQGTLDLFIFDLEVHQRTDVCEFYQWSLSARNNALVSWNYLAELHSVDSPADGDNLIARYRGISTAIDNEIATLRLGLENGRVANRVSVQKVFNQLQTNNAEPISQWPLAAPITQPHPQWDESVLAQFQSDLLEILDDEIAPALLRYERFIETEILPIARLPGQEGLNVLPGGDLCYEALISQYTTLPYTAEQIHQSGLRELETIHREFEEIGLRALGTSDISEIFSRLRTDPQLYFTSEQEIEDKAVSALSAAQQAMSEYFGVLPKTDCEVRRIPDYEAPYTTIAYYRPPHADGSKPGEYFVNTHEPTTRPRHEAEVLAFHESIPGHHLQIAISKELPALPAFRRHGGHTVFIEGWALYTERLADEMGLYSGDLDRLGMLSFDAWRASRLVVDTGIHGMGWSRSQAETFLEVNTPLALNNIVNEVDRYINTPGQALAYKTGQLYIRGLRQQAEETLGDQFSLSAFHDVVLGTGAVPMPVLDVLVRNWIERLEEIEDEQ